MNRNAWKPLTNTITVVQAALTNAQRQVSAIDDVVGTTNSLRLDLSHVTEEFAELRFWGTASDGNINVIEIYVARGVNDDYTHVGALTITTGTMVVRGVTGVLYADIMTWSETDSSFQLTIVNSGNNDIAKAWINTNGYDRILMVASTLASTNVHCEVGFTYRAERPSTSEIGDLDTLLTSIDTELTAQGLSLDSLVTEQASQGTAIDLINTNLQDSLIDNSASGENEKLTITANVAVGANQACTSCMVVWSGTGPVTVNDGGVADTNDFPLPTESTGVGSPVSFPVENTNQLNFWSATNGDVINLFWRA